MTPEFQWLPNPTGTPRRHENAPAAAGQDDLIHAGFLARVRAQPDRVALISSDNSMTYGDLAQRAGQLAQRLLALGVKPNSLVAVSAAKGHQQVVGVLGVLMAGAAYLPIDPDLPDERRRFLLEHGQVQVVVTAANGGPTWPSSVAQVPVINEDANINTQPHTRPLQAPSDLAYVIYTSGSTGAPKGVAISHRAAWNTIRDINDRFGVSSDDRVLSVSSLSFDLSVYDIFGVLAAGGAVVMPNRGTAPDPRHWLELCEAHQVTIWNSVPALMELAVEQVQVGAPRPASLRLVLLSGDWIPIALPDRVRALADKAQVVSLGGATEAAIWSIFYVVDEVDPGWSSIPYGKPLGNQYWEILNDRLEPCPVHVPGDLYIGGQGLAEGYWRDEEKTAARFVCHPQTGERLYRTGDLGRYLPDSNIEFLGRVDGQVKINGHRIELGEIEAYLAAHPRVRAAAVAAVGETMGHRRLVAYIVPEAEPVGDDGSCEPGTGSAVEPKEAPPGDSLAVTGETNGVIVTDPMQRLEFKLRRHGLRRIEDAATVDIPCRRGAKELALVNGLRRSHRRFGPGTVAAQSLSALLETLRAADNESGLPKYRYGSAGSLYPVQAYVEIAPHRVEGVSAGTYYYDPDAHALRAVSPGVYVGPGVHASNNKALVEQAAFAIFLVGEMAAIEPLYVGQAERFCLIEAGLITQLLEMEAIGCGVGLCQVAIGDDPALRQALVLGESQIMLHGLVGGQAVEVSCDSGPLATDDERLEAELRQWLAGKLPSYMVPAQFVARGALPLTANGKVDRNALSRLAPDLGTTEGATSAGDGRVRGEALLAGPAALRLAGQPTEDRAALVLEMVLSAIVAVLGPQATRAIDSDRPFVELGLDSLQALQLRTRLEGVSGLPLPATVVFDYPTPKLLAELIAKTTFSADGDTVSIEDELAQIERRLRVLASSDPARATVVSRLVALGSTLSGGQTEETDSDLSEATAENIFELVDSELGLSPAQADGI